MSLSNLLRSSITAKCKTTAVTPTSIWRQPIQQIHAFLKITGSNNFISKSKQRHYNFNPKSKVTITVIIDRIEQGRGPPKKLSPDHHRRGCPLWLPVHPKKIPPIHPTPYNVILNSNQRWTSLPLFPSSFDFNFPSTTFPDFLQLPTQKSPPIPNNFAWSFSLLKLKLTLQWSQNKSFLTTL